MAAAIGTENLAVVRSCVEDRLFAEPYSFEFVQAVRLLQMFYPNRNPVGLFGSPDSEVARFGVRAGAEPGRARVVPVRCCRFAHWRLVKLTKCPAREWQMP